jgi:hypothetical protein
MANDKKGADNVVGIGQCRSEKCSKKEEKMGFCKEHYGWFKEGLITKDGKRPSDFDKKYQAFLHRKPTGKAA